jgi:Protein of unknown function (DUF3750)
MDSAVKTPWRRRLAVRAFALVFMLPLVARAAWLPFDDRPMHWYQADWSSTGALPSAARYRPARVLVLSGRTGSWKGIFAVHTWIVLKRAGARHWTRYDVVGWGRPVHVDNWPADGRWFGDRPTVVADVKGARAAAMIPKIEAAIAAYPYDHYGDYRIWPGPNSNTFIATVLRAVPEMGATLLPDAVGRDFRPDIYFGTSDSRTGIEVNFWGVAGIKVGWVEGIEFNLLGLVAGLDLRHPALKLPGFGRLDLGILTGTQAHTLGG